MFWFSSKEENELLLSLYILKNKCFVSLKKQKQKNSFFVLLKDVRKTNSKCISKIVLLMVNYSTQLFFFILNHYLANNSTNWKLGLLKHFHLRV